MSDTTAVEEDELPTVEKKTKPVEKKTKPVEKKTNTVEKITKPVIEKPVEESEDEDETIEWRNNTPKKQKNPNRVKAGIKLTAMGQKYKEEKMRRRVKEEMYKPSTWILMGVTLASIGFLGLYFSPLFPTSEKENSPPSKKEEPKTTNYFG